MRLQAVIKDIKAGYKYRNTSGWTSPTTLEMKEKLNRKLVAIEFWNSNSDKVEKKYLKCTIMISVPHIQLQQSQAVVNSNDMPSANERREEGEKKTIADRSEKNEKRNASKSGTRMGEIHK